ncbi:hypothetical protein AGMMS49960_08120 [Betaproteobacteria bacterium]|nr:hypothetical protein AGMMS49543_26810 [Betaproteobacteria bacterium]GHU00337.1 hypothetical protein AGMMS49960_08120 [Betaproteobacteria bacterium]GHU24842.1 hypothetical protein AGMMS50243_28440 [Betaproteobacteria bacterium]
MSTINEAYINALLADATYAISNGGSITVEDNRNSLDASLTISQAKFIADNFEIVSHFLAWQKPPNPPPKHAVTCLPSSPAAS